MTMRCSFDDGLLTWTNTSTSASGSLVGRRDVNSTQQIATLSSIAITRDGMDIATVSYANPARSLVDTNVFVTGSISGQSGLSGFLELTWDYPLSEQIGEYVCELNGLTASGHNVVLTKSLSVNAGEATLDDLITHIHDLEIKTQTLENCCQSQKAKIQALENKSQSQENEIQAVKSDLSEARHIESGQISCGRQSTWADLANNQVSQSFHKVYKQAPVVHLSVTVVDTQVVNKTYLYYTASLVSVDTNGFVVNCFSHPDSVHGKVIQLNLDWIAVPQ